MSKKRRFLDDILPLIGVTVGGITILKHLRGQNIIATVSATDQIGPNLVYASFGSGGTTAKPATMVNFVSGRPKEEIAAYAAALQKAGIAVAVDKDGNLWVDGGELAQAGNVIRETEQALR